MGSVRTTRECPECSFKGDITLNYKTREEYFLCNRCGYYYHRLIPEEERRKNKSLDEIDYEQKEEKGIGFCKIMYGCGGSSFGISSEEEIEDIKDKYKKGELNNEEGKQPTGLKYTFKKNGKWFIRDLINDKTFSFNKKIILDNI